MIIILGTPGAGKTTQARLLSKKLGCPWFSTGQLIRDNVTGQDRKDMLSGKIIDDSVTLKIIDKVLKDKSPDGKCIFEGSPRTTTQAKWWQDEMDKGRFKVEGIIHLAASLAVAEQRIDGRGRLDDHDDNVVETRMEQYQKSIKPTLEYLKQSGLPVHEINADGTIEEVAAAINKALGV